MISRLKELRKKKSYTQINIQMKTNIDQSSYFKFENGKRTPSTVQIICLAKVLNTSIDYIMGNTDDPKPYPKKGPTNT